MFTVRPRPIFDAAKNYLTKVGGISTLVSLALAVGVISSDQASAITNVMIAVMPLLHAGSNLLTAFGIVHAAEPKVTPLIAPQANDGTPLVPATGPANPTA